MKTIGLCGFKDKRVWIYAIIKTLAQIHNIKFVTNTAYYKMFNPDYDAEFELAGCTVQVVKDDFSNLDDLIEVEGFDFIIYDCTDNLPDYLDYAMILDNMPYYKDLLEVYPQEKMKIYYPAEPQAKKTPQNILQVIPLSLVAPLLDKIEATRNLTFVSGNAKVTMSIIRLLSDMLEIPQKELMKFIKRKKPILF